MRSRRCLIKAHLHGGLGGLHRRAAVVIAIAGVLLLAGCRTDMHVQPKMKPLRESDFFADTRGSRPLVNGTVARGQLREDSYYYTGTIGNQPGDYMPFPATKEVLERGQERFNIYCSPCHSRLGDGNGMVVQRGYRRPPSFHSPRLQTAPLGHFFDVMTNGFGAMPDYAAQVPPHDRWAIAAYIRALQLSQHAPAEAIPPGQKVPATLIEVPSTSGSGATLPPEQQGMERKPQK